jgi:hypothetical protein
MAFARALMLLVTMVECVGWRWIVGLVVQVAVRFAWMVVVGLFACLTLR